MGHHFLSNGDNNLNVVANGNEVSVVATTAKNAASAWSIHTSGEGYVVQNILTGLYLNEANGVWSLSNTEQALTITANGTDCVISNGNNTFQVAGISAWTLTENAAQAEVAAVGHGKIQNTIKVTTMLGNDVNFTLEDALSVTDWNAYNLNYQPYNGQYYRIKSASRNKYFGLSTDGSKPFGVDYDANDFSQIWMLVASGNGFKLCNPNMNAADPSKGYFGGTNQYGGEEGAMRDQNGEWTSLYLDTNGAADGQTFISLTDTFSTIDRSQYLNMESNGKIDLWRSQDAQYIITKVETINIPLATVGANTYASVCLPFAVTVGSDVKAYVGDGAVDYNSLKFQEATEIAAEAGCIIEGTAASTTLTIGASDAASSSSILGTFRSVSINNDNRANYLVFGKNASNEVGFYSMASTLTAIPANKAYLNVASGNAVKLIFPGNVTGIEAIETVEEADNAPVYDLSGRRVLAPAKGGINVKNGKKFIVK